MYFLLPFINSTQDYYKNAKIDVMVKSESQKQVFENLNLNKIITSSLCLIAHQRTELFRRL